MLNFLQPILALLATGILAVAGLCMLAGCFGSGIDWRVRLELAFGGALLSPVGAALLQFAKKLRAQDALSVLAHDNRQPVLYLRSFLDDSAAATVPHQEITSWFGGADTEEEQLAQVLGQIGPVVAIGRPGELLPELGASRLYVGDDEWQAVVSRLMAVSRLVVLRAKRTRGLFWEAEHAASRLRPEQILFLVPRDLDYAAFRASTDHWFPRGLPAEAPPGQRMGSLRGLVYFRSDWTPVYLPPAQFFFRHRLRHALVPVLQMTLEPVFKQLGVPWKPPPIRWGLYAIGLLAITWPIFYAIVVLALRAMGLIDAK
jgi:hypothetical protein